jgi:hypothetical protein
VVSLPGCLPALDAPLSPHCRSLLPLSPSSFFFKKNFVEFGVFLQQKIDIVGTDGEGWRVAERVRFFGLDSAFCFWQ